MELPTKKSPPKEDNPKFTILFGKPKSGKTTITAALPDALHIDLEDGTDYVESMAVKIKTVDDLRTLIQKLNENKEHSYTFGVIDTATKLEDMILPIALQMYNQTPMGKSYKGDVRMLPNGGGY